MTMVSEDTAVQIPQQDPPENDTRVGSVIKYFRNRAQLSQAAVSQKMSHRTPEWLGMIESNVRSLDLEKIPALAAILNVNARDLIVLALHQYFPKAANVLFPGEAELKMPSEEKDQQVQLLPASMEHIQDYDNLSAEHQHLIREMTKALMQSTRSTVRVNRSKLAT